MLYSYQLERRSFQRGEIAIGDSIMTSRPLYVIAEDIRKHWVKINYAAKPYLDAMASCTNINDNYYADSARSVVLYFLSNASTWRGPDAKRIKDELRAMMK